MLGNTEIGTIRRVPTVGFWPQFFPTFCHGTTPTTFYFLFASFFECIKRKKNKIIVKKKKGKEIPSWVDRVWSSSTRRSDRPLERPTAGNKDTHITEERERRERRNVGRVRTLWLCTHFITSLFLPHPNSSILFLSLFVCVLPSHISPFSHPNSFTIRHCEGKKVETRNTHLPSALIYPKIFVIGGVSWLVWTYLLAFYVQCL